MNRRYQGGYLVAKNSVGARARPPVHPGSVIADISRHHKRIWHLAGSGGAAMRPLARRHETAARMLEPGDADAALRLGTGIGNGPELRLNLQQAYDLWHARARRARTQCYSRPQRLQPSTAGAEGLRGLGRGRLVTRSRPLWAAASDRAHGQFFRRRSERRL